MPTNLDRAAVEGSFRRRLYGVFIGAFIIAFAVLVPSAFAFINKKISVHVFAVIGLVYMAGIFLAIMAVSLNAQKRLRPFASDSSKPPDSAEQERLRRSIRSLVRAELLYGFGLIYGLWRLRGETWTPIVIGVTISLFIQGWLITTILRFRKRLKLAQDPSART